MKSLHGVLRLSTARQAAGLMLAFVALFVGLFAYFVNVGIGQNQERLEERSASAAQIVATNAYWIVELADQTLARVDAALGQSLLGAEADFRAVLQGLPTVADVYVIDGAANTLYSTLDGAASVSIIDREYFTAVRDGVQFYISGVLTSRINGEQIFVFSKRVERNDEFAGAIMISFPQSLLQELWGTLDLYAGSTISLVRGDGQLMARHPPSDGPVDLASLPLFQQYLPNANAGTYTSASSPVDGLARVVSYRQVADHPIIALASVASDEVWANFQRGIWTVILIVSPVLVALIAGCGWIVRLLIRDEAYAKQLKESVDLNTMLFREIHHRVKNNLQSIQGLVRMQHMPEPIKLDLQSRLAAMAAMHEHIYKHDRYEDIDAHDFIPAVVDQVKAAYGSDASVQYELEHIPVDRDHATPLALLLSELATNAFKYAFVDDRPAALHIRLTPRDDGRANLVVRDNGVGMTEPANPRSMGMRLVKGIVAQMGGEYEFRNEGGLVFDANVALSVAVRKE